MGLGFCFRFTVVCLSFIVKRYLVESASVARNINQMIEVKPQTAMLDGLDKTRIVYPPTWNLSVPVTTDLTYSNDSSAKAQSVNHKTLSTWNQKVFSGDFSNGLITYSNGHADRSESNLAPRLIMSPSSVGQVRSNNKLHRLQPNYNLVLRNLIQNLYKENISRTLLADDLIDGKQHDEKTTQYATCMIKITERSTIVRAIHPKIVPLKNLFLPVLSRPKDTGNFTSCNRSCNHKLKPLYLAPSKEFQGNYKPVNFIRAIINYTRNGIQPHVSNKTSVDSNEKRMFQTLDIKSHQNGYSTKIIFSNEHYPLASSNNVQTPKAVVMSSKSKNFWIAPSPQPTISTSVLQKYELNQLNHTAVHLDKTDLNSFLNQGHVHPTIEISNGNDIEHFSSRENATHSLRSTSSFVIGRRMKVSSMIRNSDNLMNTRSQSSVSKSPIIRKQNIKYKLSNNLTINFSDNKTPPEIINPELTAQAKKSPMQNVSFPKPIGLKNFTPIEFIDVAGSASFHVNR